MSEGPQIVSWSPPRAKESPFANDNPDSSPPPPRLIQSSADFTRDFVPPDYLIDGILQRRFCYALTATTGTGKTAIMLRASAHVALGRQIGSLQVEQGKVLRMRWIGLSGEMGFDEKEAEVYFIPCTFKISALRARIAEEMKRIGEFSLIVIDTSAAYFEGEEENSNSQMGAHARRLRSLCEMPGGPCVLIACHPVKNAGEDNLLPRGGGAFLAVANHAYDCCCGFGRDTGGGGRRWGNVSHFALNYSAPSFGWSRDSGGTVESYVNPNAHCPVCGRSVFFYRSPYNGRVFFDDLGWPWPKHGCTDNRGEPRRATRNTPLPASAVITACGSLALTKASRAFPTLSSRSTRRRSPMKPQPRSPQLCWRLHKVHRAQRFEMTRRSGLPKSAVDLGPEKAASKGSRPREQVYRTSIAAISG